MGKPQRRSQKRHQASRLQALKQSSQESKQGLKEQISAKLIGFTPLKFALPKNFGELSSLEQDLNEAFVLDKPNITSGKINWGNFLEQEKECYAQVPEVKTKLLDHVLEQISAHDQDAAELVEVLLYGLSKRPLSEVKRFANTVERLFAPELELSVAKRRITLYGLVLHYLIKNFLVIFERYSIFQRVDEKFVDRCCWIQMLADGAFDRLQLRLVYAYTNMVQSEEQELWQSFRYEGREMLSDIKEMAVACLIYNRLKNIKEKLLAAAPDRAAVEAKLWFQPIPLSSIPETSSELKAREYLDLD